MTNKKKKNAVAAGFKLPSQPPRTPVVPEQAAEFVGGAPHHDAAVVAEAGRHVTAAQQSSNPTIQQPGRPAGAPGPRKGLVDRKHGQLRRLMVYLPPDLGERLEEYAFRQRRELSDVVGEALRKLLDS